MLSEELLQSNLEKAKHITNQAETLKSCDLELLTWKENKNSWSILECIEHLNLYADYYLPKIEDKIKNSTIKNDVEFKSSLLGSYFAKSMLPKEKLNKMKTFKNKNPLNADLDKSVIDSFINHQTNLINLLNLSKKISLNKVKIPISISSLIRLNLGDTYQFYINHIIRHFAQIDRIKSKIHNV